MESGRRIASKVKINVFFHFISPLRMPLRVSDRHVLPTLQNVTFWRATRCGVPKIAQKLQEKAKNHQYLTKNVHVW